MEVNLKMIVFAGAAIALIGTGAIYYYAVLNKPMRTVTIQLSGNGRVLMGTPGAYLTSIQVNDGDSLKLAASPDTGWKFSQWSGDITGNTNPTTITVTKDMTITATFTK
jgi:Divergent InlB B-repeat domain